MTQVFRVIQLLKRVTLGNQARLTWPLRSVLVELVQCKKVFAVEDLRALITSNLPVGVVALWRRHQRRRKLVRRRWAGQETATSATAARFGLIVDKRVGFLQIRVDLFVHVVLARASRWRGRGGGGDRRCGRVLLLGLSVHGSGGQRKRRVGRRDGRGRGRGRARRRWRHVGAGCVLRHLHHGAQKRGIHLRDLGEQTRRIHAFDCCCCCWRLRWW